MTDATSEDPAESSSIPHQAISVNVPGADIPAGTAGGSLPALPKDLPGPPPSASLKPFWLTVGNGAFSMMGSAFFAGDTVLAGLVERLTKSSLRVGALVSVSNIGWMWPQLFVGHWLESKPRKMPAYALSALGRFSALILMACATAFWRGSPGALYWILFLNVALFTSFGGIVGIPFMDIVAKTIPRKRLPALWAYRNVFGGVLGFLSSLVIAYVLSARSGIPFYYNYALLFSIAAVLNGSAYLMFYMVREPVEPVSRVRAPFLTYLRRGVAIFRCDRDYRLLYLYRCVWAGATMSQAVFVPCAIRYFDASPAKTGGWFTGVILLVGGVSSLIWGWATQRFGEVRILRCTGTLVLCSPLIAFLLTVSVHVGGPVAEFVRSHYVWVYVLIYACAAAANNGNTIAYNVYALSLPPPELRPSYLAFINTLVVPLLLAPTLAGFLVEHVPYPVVFAISCLSAVGAMRVASRLRAREEGAYPIRGDLNCSPGITNESSQTPT